MAGGGFPRALLSDSRAASALHEECELWLALAAEDGEIDLDAADVARLGEDDGLPLEALRRQHSTRAGERGVAANALEVPRELLDRLDRPDALDLDGHPAVQV